MSMMFESNQKGTLICYLVKSASVIECIFWCTFQTKWQSFLTHLKSRHETLHFDINDSLLDGKIALQQI